MSSISLKQQVAGYLSKHFDLEEKKQQETAMLLSRIFGNFSYELFIPASWQLLDIERKEYEALIFHWQSHSQEAECSVCGEESHNRLNLYRTRKIQDLPISKMTVSHSVKLNYGCNNPDCPNKMFVEQFPEIVEKDALISNRLKDTAVHMAVELSCSATTKKLNEMGAKISKDTVNRAVKKGAEVIAANLKRNDVRVLSIDDINLRKGNKINSLYCYH